MYVELHAAALLGCAVGTLALLVFGPRRRPAPAQAFLAALVFFAVVYLFRFGCFGWFDGCIEGCQWLIPASCVYLVLAYVRPLPVRLGVAALLVAAAWALSAHFSNIVQDPHWSGTPQLSIEAKVRTAVLNDLASQAAEFSSDTTSYPAGWLRELPFAAGLRMVNMGAAPRRDVHLTWHTWATGLYPVDYVCQDFWYPGGPPATGLAAVECRDRPGFVVPVRPRPASSRPAP